MTVQQSQPLVEVRPLKPFVGSYKCSLAEADTLDDGVEEKDGNIVKTKIPRKRYIGLISAERILRVDEIEAALRGELPDNIELVDPDALKHIGPGMQTVPTVLAVEHPKNRTVKVPADVASSLISRGLAERVIEAKRAGK